MTSYAPPNNTPNLYDLSDDELAALLAAWDQPAYRARQITEWLYQHKVSSAEQMTNLPRSLRERLAARCQLRSAT